MHKYITEFIGTFFLCLTIGLTVALDVAMAPLAIGATLMIMVYMGGHISGGHYNPAVTLAVLIRRKIGVTDAVIYWVVQIAGGLAAAFLAFFLVGKGIAVAPGEGVDVVKAITNEFIWTLALALVVLNTATSKAVANNSFYGLAIGFTVVCAAFAGGSISGGAYNPAVGIAHNLAPGGDMAQMWIHIVGPLAGGLVAGLLYWIMNPDEAKDGS